MAILAVDIVVSLRVKRLRRGMREDDTARRPAGVND
jgi:hypothetical protein